MGLIGLVVVVVVILLIRAGLEPTPKAGEEAHTKWREEQERIERMNQRLHEQTKGKWWR